MGFRWYQLSAAARSQLNLSMRIEFLLDFVNLYDEKRAFNKFFSLVVPLSIELYLQASDEEFVTKETYVQRLLEVH